MSARDSIIKRARVSLALLSLRENGGLLGVYYMYECCGLIARQCSLTTEKIDKKKLQERCFFFSISGTGSLEGKTLSLSSVLGKIKLSRRKPVVSPNIVLAPTRKPLTKSSSPHSE